MDQDSDHESASTVSLFGKLSTTADFVRIHHASEIAVELDVWLNAALQELHSAKLRWPEAPLRFVFLSASQRAALTGVIVDSRDRAGRKFPLAVYRSIPVAPLSQGLPALPLVTEPFHEAVEAALPELASMTREQVAARLRELETPLTAFATAGRELAASLQNLAAVEFERGLFIGDVAAQARDAYDTACQAARRAELRRSGATTTLDFPIRSTRDACAWLTLWAQLLPANTLLPSCIWSDRLNRLLVVHGPLPAAVPSWLAAPNKQRSQRIEVGVRYAFVALDQSPFQACVTDANAANTLASDPAHTLSVLERFEQTRGVPSQ
jgi:type VI secretion system protein ImpM